MSGGGGSTTQVTQSGPPPQFIAGYQDVLGKAQNVAQTPYQPYPGNLVAPMSPSQQAGITAGQQSVGVAVPYINAAAQYMNNATKPLWPSVQQFSGDAVRQYESPYTQDVTNATRALFNEQNAQQQQNVIGNAITHGAWGGDRSAVAQSILAGQQQLAEAPTLANIQNEGYKQALQEFNQQQGAQLGANQANAWLNSQAGYGTANLGNQALQTTLTGANTLLGIGGMEQGQAQAELNVPFQQWQAAQAYPFQTTGWLANIAEGLGGASGGTSSTTSPGPSVGSQVLGGGLAAAGLLNQTGAFGGGGGDGWLSGLFGSGGGGSGFLDSGVFDVADGGAIPARAPGGIIPTDTSIPIHTGIPDVSLSVVPGAEGMGVPADHHGSNLLNTSMGSTSKTEAGDNTLGTIANVVKIVGTVAALLARGGAVGGRGIVASPQHHLGRGILPPQRAEGGATAPILTGSSPLVTTIPGSYDGSPPVPVLSSPIGGPGNGATNDYLATVRAGAFHGLPTVYTPPPPPPPAAPGGLGGGGGGYGAGNPLYSPGNDGSHEPGNPGEGGVSADVAAAGAGGMGVDAAHDTGQTEIAAGASGGFGGGFEGADMSGEPGGGGLWARGGEVHRDDGGLLDYSRLWRDADPAMGGIAPSRIFGEDVPPLGRLDVPVEETAEETPEETAEAPRYRGPDQSTAPAAPAGQDDTAPAAPDEIDPRLRQMNHQPFTQDAKGIVPSGGSGSDWGKTLLYTGLGIMGGTSPHMGVNIGRGALAGLKQAEESKYRDELARYRQDRLAETDTYHRGSLGTRERGQDLRHEEAGQRQVTAREGHALRERIAARAADLREKGLTENQANAQARLEILRQNADTNTTYKGARLAQTDENTDLRKQQIAQAAERIANSREAQAAAQEARREGRDAAAVNTDIRAAANMVASGTVPTFAEALKAVRSGRATATPAPAAAAPRTPPQAAIDLLRQRPELAPQFRQKYGIDPAPYLSGG